MFTKLRPPIPSVRANCATPQLPSSTCTLPVAPIMFAIVAFAFAACPLRALALPITYHLDYSGNFSVSGSITTDGTIGALAASNLQAWAFTVTAPPSLGTFTLDEINSIASLSGVTATSDELLLNLSGDLLVHSPIGSPTVFGLGISMSASGTLLFSASASSSGSSGRCPASAVDPTCSLSDVVSGAAVPYGLATNQIPLPATLALVALSLPCLALTRKRRNRLN